MIRISNSSTENFDKNSLSTVYWIGSFFSKLYRPPCFSYLFSTYANRLIQYAYSHLFFSIIRWLWKAPLELHHSHSDGRTVSYGRIIIQIYRSWQRLFQQSLTDHWRGRSLLYPSFHGSWRSSPSARCISNVSDYCIQLSKNTRLYLSVYGNPLSEIMDFHRLTSGAEGKGEKLRPSE